MGKDRHVKAEQMIAVEKGHSNPVRGATHPNLDAHATTARKDRHVKAEQTIPVEKGHLNPARGAIHRTLSARVTTARKGLHDKAEQRMTEEKDPSGLAPAAKMAAGGKGNRGAKAEQGTALKEGH